jgi:hypothetical protein
MSTTWVKVDGRLQYAYVAFDAANNDLYGIPLPDLVHYSRSIATTKLPLFDRIKIPDHRADWFNGCSKSFGILLGYD